MKYGARHLKRAIERSLVHPLSNLIASEQIRAGDLVSIDYDTATASLTFTREAESMPGYEMAELIDTASIKVAAAAIAQQAAPARPAAAAGRQRK
jgi:hypothetical protein